MNNTFSDELDDEQYDEDPFGEEFDRDDVVNSKIDDSDIDDDGLPDVDVDSILNYDEERRKKEYFENDYNSEDENRPVDEIIQKNFKDFLVARKISGKLEGIGSGSRIPSERIHDSGKKVEISDDPGHSVIGDKKTTIVVQRNETGEITNIEVLCSCGEKTTIALGFGETSAVSHDNTEILEIMVIPDVGRDQNFND